MVPFIQTDKETDGPTDDDGKYINNYVVWQTLLTEKQGERQDLSSTDDGRK